MRRAMQWDPEAITPGPAAELCTRAAVLAGLTNAMHGQKSLGSALPFLSDTPYSTLGVPGCKYKDVPGKGLHGF